MSILSKIFPSENTRNINKLKKMADKVMALEDKYSQLSDAELSSQTKVLKERLLQGEKLNDVLPDAFAVVREASTRVLGLRHYYVQLIGGIALHQGRIAEMKTGEGKTLVETLPAYLNALTEKGVHIITVNEYLAKRDSEWMGKVFKFLGLTVGVSFSGQDPKEKQKAYLADITYTTNNELGFDYLRDNMVIRKEDRVLRDLNFAIVDEVDSILIDEARTPLIISGRGMKSSDSYVSANKFVKSLREEDYLVDIKLKNISLTESGVSKAERNFGVETLTDIDNIELNHYINNALKANYIMFEGQNYIVKDNEIVIVDEFTGRLMKGRRYSDGLHQAIEAKENVPIKSENKTLATITFQNLFKIYPKLSGMTGTAKTEETEFNSTYNLDVVCIPSNKPCQRKDEADVIYTTIEGKNRAIAAEIADVHSTGRPVLVGTITIEKSEELSKVLSKAKIAHVVLNAKNHEQESEIIAQAGRINAVTIATNMAGRGTDILLGGNPEYMAKAELKKQGIDEGIISLATAQNFTSASQEVLEVAKKYKDLFETFKRITDKEREEVLSLGGLHIIGTERHESRRIDNQLRGRAGRQGDPGSSVFFISLEDDLVRRFGGDRIKSIVSIFKVDEDTPFQLKVLSNQIEKAQKRIEMQHYSARKSVLKFDDVLNKQRDIIYSERNSVLNGDDVHEQIMDMYPEIVMPIVNSVISDAVEPEKWDIDALNTALELKLFPAGTNILSHKIVKNFDVKDVCDYVLKKIEEKYNDKIIATKEKGIDFSNFERYILLKVVDTLWMDHIDAMSSLKNDVGLQAYGNHDPIIVYKQEGFDMFEKMIEKIRTDTAILLLNADINNAGASNSTAKQTIQIVASKPAGPAKSDKTVSRNAPCPCGSGKKYKNCCGKNE